MTGSLRRNVSSTSFCSSASTRFSLRAAATISGTSAASRPVEDRLRRRSTRRRPSARPSVARRSPSASLARRRANTRRCRRCASARRPCRRTARPRWPTTSPPASSGAAAGRVDVDGGVVAPVRRRRRPRRRRRSAAAIVVRVGVDRLGLRSSCDGSSATRRRHRRRRTSSIGGGRRRSADSSRAGRHHHRHRAGGRREVDVLVGLAERRELGDHVDGDEARPLEHLQQTVAPVDQLLDLLAGQLAPAGSSPSTRSR